MQPMIQRSTTTRLFGVALALAFVATFGMIACGSSSPPPAGNQQATGTSCTSASQCFAGLEASTITGAECLNVTGGYCTHTCTTDADCCAVAGECAPGVHGVCSPFQSTGQNLCFLSCETGDITPAGLDPNTFCQRYASAVFTCRSTGGGSNNRKVCLP